MEHKGIFISLEGGEGAGKSSAAAAMTRWLEEKGYEVLLTREPGGSKIAEQIRRILLDPANVNLDPKAEAALYAASRAQHLQETILPALRENKVVLCDRYIDSSLVYQGYARDLGIEKVTALNAFVIDGCMPDLTLYFSVDVNTGLSRVRKRGEMDRMDAQSLPFHQKVKEGYDIIAEMYPQRIVRVDAGADEKSLAEACIQILQDRLHL